MKQSKFISGFILGAIGGAILGILFAPDKGTETRKLIASKGNDLADGLKKKVDDGTKELKSDVDKTKEEVSDWAKSKEYNNLAGNTASTF